MLEKLAGDLLDLRVRELGRRAPGLALPAVGCCSCSSSCSGGRKQVE